MNAQQFGKVYIATLSKFTTREQLARFTRSMDLNLEEVGTGNLRDTTFSLVQYMESQGRIWEFVTLADMYQDDPNIPTQASNEDAFREIRKELQ